MYKLLFSKCVTHIRAEKSRLKHIKRLSTTVDQINSNNNNTDITVRVARDVYFGVGVERVINASLDDVKLFQFFLTGFVDRHQQLIPQQYFYMNTRSPIAYHQWFFHMDVLHLRDHHSAKEMTAYWNADNRECGTHVFMDHTHNLLAINNTMTNGSLVTSDLLSICELMPNYSFLGAYYAARKYVLSDRVRASDGFRMCGRFGKMFGFGGVFDLKPLDVSLPQRRRYVQRYLTDDDECVVNANYFGVYVEDNARLLVSDQLYKRFTDDRFHAEIISHKFGDYIYSRTLFTEKSFAAFQGTFAVCMTETGDYYSRKQLVDKKLCHKLLNIKHPVFIVGRVHSKYDTLCWNIYSVNDSIREKCGIDADWCFAFPQNYNLIDIIEFDLFVNDCRRKNYFASNRHVSTKWPKEYENASKPVAAVIHCNGGKHYVKFEDVRFKKSATTLTNIASG